MAETVRVIRVFLASPGDVAEERAQARHLVKDELPALPFIKDKVWLKIIAWEDPTSRAPMPATLSPQKAIELGMTKPSECDLAVVVFWSRMGTPLDEARHGLKDGKRPYWSGTEWEYEDALKASEATGKPVVLVYRRTAGVSLNPETHDFDERVQQLKRVKEFFAEFRDAKTGAWLRSYTEYETPEQFGEMLKADLLHYLNKMLEEEPAAPVSKVETAPKLPEWEGSPFPGLRAFTPDEAPIFFGRGRETDALLKRVSESRFVTVVGASGSGKSSLVGAGLIPRLKDNALPGSKDWLLPYRIGSKDKREWAGLRFTLGEVSDNPFTALAVRLAPLLADTRPRDLADQLAADPKTLCILCEQTLAGQPDWAELLLFIDQFEELFTTVKPEYRTPFVDLLACAANTNRLRTVLTLRADFYHRCVGVPRLAELLREGSFPLAAPELDALLDMIERPAVLAGLKFEAGLPGRILRDTGQEPGALALMAYALDELHSLAKTRGDHAMTFADYEVLGGVQGAIGTRAESVFSKLGQAVQDTLPHVFRELVEVDERGTATRQRAPLSRFEGDAAAWTMLEKFTGARLLTTGGNDNHATIEVAHEALFRNWPRLAAWIETAQDDLRLLRQVRLAAHEWGEHGRALAYLWPDERLKPVYAMQERLQPDLDAVTRDFIRPEAERLLAELEDINTPHQHRSRIGERLSIIGDPRPGVGLRQGNMPDIAWCYIQGTSEKNPVMIKGHNFHVASFYMAKYPITWLQFQSFVKDGGYLDEKWWQGLKRQSKQSEQDIKLDSYPKENVRWYEAVAFCRWLTEKYANHSLTSDDAKTTPWIIGQNCIIRLPTEWEWQQAATGGNPRFEYPWGPTWIEMRANTRESGLGKMTAVGMYPLGSTQTGVSDLSGNIYEWCLNEYDNLQNVKTSGAAKRVLKGGSWGHSNVYASCTARDYYVPLNWFDSYGFRVVCADFAA